MHLESFTMEWLVCCRQSRRSPRLLPPQVAPGHPPRATGQLLPSAQPLPLALSCKGAAAPARLSHLRGNWQREEKTH